MALNRANTVFVTMHCIFAGNHVICAFRLRNHATDYIEMMNNLGLNTSDYIVREIEMRFEC